MTGASPSFPSGCQRRARAAAAVVYRQAGLIAACALAGAAASLMVHAKPPRVYAAGAVARAQVDQAGSPSSLAARLAQAQADLRQTEDRIVALFVPEAGRVGAAGAGAATNASRHWLRLDLDPSGVRSGPTPDVHASTTQARTQTPAPPLRLDEARRPEPDAAGRAPPPRAVHENTPLEVALNRLERARRLAQGRTIELRRERDRIAGAQGPDSTAAGRRVGIAAPDQPGVAGAAQGPPGAVLGPLAGLLLGLLLAGRRELGGDRMRSPREAAQALGLPVLGAIPTLSAKARTACIGPPIGTLSAADSELE